MDNITLVFRTSNKETADEVDNYLSNHYRDHISEFRVKMRNANGIPIYDCIVIFQTQEEKILEEIRVELEKLLGRIDSAYSRLN